VTPHPSLDPVDDAAVFAAAERLRGVAHATPLLRSRSLDEATGGEVRLKAENLQRAGSFKFRGAYNAIAARLDEARARGVVTGSSGNHGGAVALAAKMLGVRAVVVMPTDAAAVKIAAVRSYGAHVEQVGRSSAERLARAAELSEKDGLLSVPPSDDPSIMAGQATCGMEIFDAFAPDVVVVPTGGGGLFAGTCLAAKLKGRGSEVYGVETENANDTWLSWNAKKRVRIPLPDTIADGIRTVEPGELTFGVMLRHAKGVVLVSDDDVRAAVRFLFERTKQVVEPTGAVSVAALLSKKLPIRGRKAVAVLSGGNVDPDVYARLIA
jgi:threo-3-hydroxy-L-aspartate ammonia-lyase